MDNIENNQPLVSRGYTPQRLCNFLALKAAKLLCYDTEHYRWRLGFVNRYGYRIVIVYSPSKGCDNWEILTAKGCNDIFLHDNAPLASPQNILASLISYIANGFDIIVNGEVLLSTSTNIENLLIEMDMYEI